MSWNNELLVKKSRLAPYEYSCKKSYYTIGDRYARILLLTQLPKEFTLGILSQFISSPDIKMQVVTEKLDMDCTTALRKEYNDKSDQYRKSVNDLEKASRLYVELESLNNYINDIVRNNDTTLNVTIVFNIFANSLEQLDKLTKKVKEELGTQGIFLFSSKLMQEQLFKLASPLFVESGLQKEVEFNVGIPLPSYSVAGLYPFVFETLKDPKGFILGHEYGNKGIILFDQFYWKNEPIKSTTMNRTSGNMVVVGDTGAGKTTVMKLLIRNYIRSKKKIIWIDPENKNMSMTKRYGGTFINFGRKGNIINVFDLKPISVEEDEDPSIMWDTETAIYNVIDDVKIILSYLDPTMKYDTLSIVGDVALRMYKNHGISMRKSFRGMEAEDFPTFTDFDATIDELIQEYEQKPKTDNLVSLLYDLKLKIKPVMNEYSMFFNGHTMIKPSDSERQIISFGTKILFNKKENLKNALNYIMYQYSWSLCLDDSQESAFILDEASTQILEETSVALVAQYARRSRKYFNVCVVGTQQPRDFIAEDIIKHGQAIFDNSPYKIIMHLEKQSIEDVSKLTRLNENEMKFIEDCHQGDALFCCGNKRIPIHVIPTQNELDEM